MKNIKNLWVILCASVAIASCGTEEEQEVLGGNIDRELELTPPKMNGTFSVDDTIFRSIDLNHNGLEKVKYFYDRDEKQYAAIELLNYFKQRTGVVNPKVNLSSISVSEQDKQIADDAVNEQRFFVNNFFEDPDKKKPYSIKKEDGTYNWQFSPAKATDEYQKQLHRHQWFLPMAKMYASTKDEKYFKEWWLVYSDWMEQNPQPAKGPNNTSWWQLQVAERLNSQLELLEYFKNSPSFSPEKFSTFLLKIAEQADFLVKYPYPDEGNILITQGSALVGAAILLPEFKQSKQWLETGKSILSDQFNKQFLEDGWHKELSLHYHIAMIVTFDDVMKLLVANNAGSILPQNITSTMEKAAEVVMNFTYPNYFEKGDNKHTMVPMFNDSWLRSRRVLKEKNYKLFVGMFPHNKHLQYMYTAGNGGNGVGELPDTELKLYDKAGFYILRNGWTPASTMIVFSNNISNNLAPYSHNQPDNGTFEFYHNGRNFFPDSGVCAYNTSKDKNELRNWFRGIDKHNTLSLVKLNKKGKKIKQNIDKADGKLLKSVEGDTEIIAFENEGYHDKQSLMPILKHRRVAFFVEKKFLVLIDQAIGSWDGEVALSYNLCPGSDNEVILDKDMMGAHTSFNDNNNIIVRTYTTEGRELNFEPFEGRIAYEVNSKYQERKAYTVNTKKGKGTARFITVIYPSASAKDSISASFIGENDDEHISIEVNINGKKYPLNVTITK